jgi:hypothetical protein
MSSSVIDMMSFFIRVLFYLFNLETLYQQGVTTPCCRIIFYRVDVLFQNVFLFLSSSIIYSTINSENVSRMWNFFWRGAIDVRRVSFDVHNLLRIIVNLVFGKIEKKGK